MTNSPSVTPHRGEIWWTSLPAEGKQRPCLIVSADWLNRYAHDVMVVPITSVPHGNFPTRIQLHPQEGGLKVRSWVKCDQVTTIHKDRLKAGPSGVLKPARMAEISQAVRESLDLLG